MPKKPFQGGSNISTSFFTRNVPRGNLCLALITVRRSDVEHSLILDDNVFPLLAAWITSHQKRLESGPWLDIKLSHDMGWAWDTRPLVELLTLACMLLCTLTRSQKTRSKSNPSCLPWWICSCWEDSTGYTGDVCSQL